MLRYLCLFMVLVTFYFWPNLNFLGFKLFKLPTNFSFFYMHMYIWLNLGFKLFQAAHMNMLLNNNFVFIYNNIDFLTKGKQVTVKKHS